MNQYETVRDITDRDLTVSKFSALILRSFLLKPPLNFVIFLFVFPA